MNNQHINYYIFEWFFFQKITSLNSSHRNFHTSFSLTLIKINLINATKQNRRVVYKLDGHDTILFAIYTKINNDEQQQEDKTLKDSNWNNVQNDDTQKAKKGRKSYYLIYINLQTMAQTRRMIRGKINIALFFVCYTLFSVCTIHVDSPFWIVFRRSTGYYSNVMPDRDWCCSAATNSRRSSTFIQRRLLQHFS